METDVNIVGMEIDGKRYASFSSDERKWCSAIKKLIKQHPGEVVVKALPETNDGCIYAFIPESWVHINPPRKTNMSQERREELAARMRKLNKHQSITGENEPNSSPTTDNEYLFNEMKDG